MYRLKRPVTYLFLMASIALASSLWREYGAGASCEMDGQPLSPGLRVDLKLVDGTSHAFCTIICAKQWLAHQPHGALKEATVRDAISGEPTDAYVAFFVRSELVTNRANGNNLHAFRFRSDAAQHIEKFGGALIEDPFGAE